MDLGDWAADFRFLVRDRARQFTASSNTVLTSPGIQARRPILPAPLTRPALTWPAIAVRSFSVACRRSSRMRARSAAR